MSALFRLFCCACGLAFLSLSALAADGLQPAYAPADRFSCYVGVFGEGIISHPEAYFNNMFGDYDMFGGRGGGIGGCDYRFASGWFVGANATAAYGKLDGRLGSQIEGELPFEAAVRVRLGTMISPTVAAYVAGGGVAGSWEQANDVGLRDSKTIVGGQAAIGLEYYLTPHWRIGTEYAYSYYGRENSTYAAGIPFIKTEVTEHALRALVSYGF